MSLPPAVSFHGIGKRFPGTVALQDVSFDVQPGRCHAVMGENGAGKSTLGKILAGIYQADEGSMKVEGETRAFASPGDAQRGGVGIVHQELSFCPNLSVAENVCLSHLPRRGAQLDWPRLQSTAEILLGEIGAECDVRQLLGELSTGQIQMAQVAAALATGARILVMDEPTSSLSAPEARRIEALIARLKARGITILYVSHKMDEIFRVCDDITVLRDGRHVATVTTKDTTHDELIRLMIGRTWEKFLPQHTDHPIGAERLRVEGFSSSGKFRDVSFQLRAGEVLGVAGLVGAGRTEIALGIFGLDPRASGRIFVDGKETTIQSPRDAIRRGIGLVSEDRKGQGLVLDMSCAENITLCSMRALSRWGVIQRAKAREVVAKYFSRLKVKAPSSDVPAAALSGGNQQKLVLGKWLALGGRVLILDEPTRGVDVGAKAEIYRLIDQLAQEGFAILMISSELPEILNLSTRIMVMRHGRHVATLERAEADETRLMELMASDPTPRPAALAA